MALVILTEFIKDENGFYYEFQLNTIKLPKYFDMDQIFNLVILLFHIWAFFYSTFVDKT